MPRLLAVAPPNPVVKIIVMNLCIYIYINLYQVTPITPIRNITPIKANQKPHRPVSGPRKTSTGCDETDLSRLPMELGGLFLHLS